MKLFEYLVQGEFTQSEEFPVLGEKMSSGSPATPGVTTICHFFVMKNR
jgi:hypothetical protein